MSVLILFLLYLHCLPLVLYCSLLHHTGQVLLSIDAGDSPAPFFPYGIWVMGLLVLCLLPIFLFKGKYLRLQEDTHQ